MNCQCDQQAHHEIIQYRKIRKKPTGTGESAITLPEEFVYILSKWDEVVSRCQEVWAPTPEPGYCCLETRPLFCLRTVGIVSMLNRNRL